TGSTRAFSSASGTGTASGRVDSPPTAIQSAPSAHILTPASTARSADANCPPSENESGVTFKTPTSKHPTPRLSPIFTSPGLLNRTRAWRQPIGLAATVRPYRALAVAARRCLGAPASPPPPLPPPLGLPPPTVRPSRG